MAFAENERSLVVEVADEAHIGIEAAIARESDVDDVWELRCLLTLATSELRATLPAWRAFQRQAVAGRGQAGT